MHKMEKSYFWKKFPAAFATTVGTVLCLAKPFKLTHLAIVLVAECLDGDAMNDESFCADHGKLSPSNLFVSGLHQWMLYNSSIFRL